MALTAEQVGKMSNHTLVSRLVTIAKQQDRATYQNNVQRANSLQGDVDMLAREITKRLETSPVPTNV